MDDSYKDQFQYCLDYIPISLPTYEKLLEAVLSLDEKPKRVIDVGCNFNQFGYLFANEGIEYYGIDIIQWVNVIQTDMIHFIRADWDEIKDLFPNEVVISSLCIGYTATDDFKCKKLITDKDVQSIEHIERIEHTEKSESVLNTANGNKRTIKKPSRVNKKQLIIK
jgi:hypothetical protein